MLIVFLIAVFHISFTCVYMPMMYGWKIGITMVVWALIIWDTLFMFFRLLARVLPS